MLRHLVRSNEIETNTGGLTPVQWCALQYFSLANRMSRTVSGFAAYNATSRGTASQIVKGIAAKGYVERVPAPDDGRSAEIVVTRRGREKLAKYPATGLARAIQRLARSDKAALERVLEALLGDPQLKAGRTRIGSCHDCACLEQCLAGAGEGNYCRHSGRRIDPRDSDLLCVVHEALWKH